MEDILVKTLDQYSIQIIKEQNIPGLLLVVDFEKAFDSISGEYIFECLKLFRFLTFHSTVGSSFK